MMRAEEGTVDGNRLPPVSVMLGTKVKGAGGTKNLETENVKAIVPDKKAKKVLSIPAPVIEELEIWRWRVGKKMILERSRGIK